jgi:hypothetical protein
MAVLAAITRPTMVSIYNARHAGVKTRANMIDEALRRNERCSRLRGSHYYLVLSFKVVRRILDLDPAGDEGEDEWGRSPHVLDPHTDKRGA